MYIHQSEKVKIYLKKGILSLIKFNCVTYILFVNGQVDTDIDDFSCPKDNPLNKH